MAPPGTGMAISAGYDQYMPPPSTGIRPPTGGLRPITGMAPPGTAARLGTAAGRIPRTPGGSIMAVAATADLQVADRPVTVHGVKGMETPGTCTFSFRLCVCVYQSLVA